MRRPSQTSRETMTQKLTYIIRIWDSSRPEVVGVGEAAIFKGLSAEDAPDYEQKLQFWCDNINQFVSFDRGEIALSDEVDYSSARFGFETALSDLQNGGTAHPFNTSDDWSIPINGLVWMGTKQFMIDEARKKLEQGFRCLKFKIGGIDFAEEIDILRAVRQNFSPEDLEIRLDANGGFTHENALERLAILSEFQIHSLEQPIKPRQWSQMAHICKNSPIPIALDEELIGMTSDSDKSQLLDTIAPQYIILKPSLCGGFSQADSWIVEAEKRGIGWWATSALESDIGLNAIARWISLKPTSMPQGLGTGQLYTNNIPSRLTLRGSHLECNPT